MRSTYIFLICVVMLATIPCVAQQQKYIGVVAGGNFANESLNPSLTGLVTSEQFGVLAGINSERWFSPQWGISLQIVYAQGGCNETLDGMGSGALYGLTTVGTGNIRTRNIDIDILLKKTFFSNNALHSYVFAGPGMNGLLSGSDRHNIVFSQKGSTFDVDTMTYALQTSKIFDFSIVVGIGTYIKLDYYPILFFDASYWYGITSIFQSYGSDAYTRDIRFTVGILFPISYRSFLF